MSKIAIISVDGHVKASRRQYRDYLEKEFLETYDEQVKAEEAAGLPDAGNLHPDLDPAVQWDSDLRHEHLESIGVVAEVLFPNGQPFQINRLDDLARAKSAELDQAGRRAYNRWLVDFCAQAPERRRGQVQLSLADVDQAVRDVHWAKENGLGGVMLPGLSRGGTLYFDPSLDPIWAACQETGLPVAQHGGVLIDPDGPSGTAVFHGLASGFGALMMASSENAFFSNRSLWMMIAGGVFDRFPDLHATWIETQVHLIVPTIAYLDRVLDSDWMGQLSVTSTLKHKPSDYFASNVTVGISPFSPNQDPKGVAIGRDAEGNQLPGFTVGVESVMFGVDLPHFETCFNRNWGEVVGIATTPIINDDEVHDILFRTAANVFDFDVDALAPHVERVGFDLDDIRERAPELRAAMPEMNTANISRGETWETRFATTAASSS